MSAVIIFTDIANQCSERPIGANVLASYLTDLSYETRVINYFLFQTDDEFTKIVETVIKNHTLLVGFSSTVLPRSESTGTTNGIEFFGLSEEQFRQRLEYIKNFAPHVKLILGGGSIVPEYLDSINRNGILEKFDYVTIGQGEEILKNILDYETQNSTNLKKDILLSSKYKTTVISDSLYPFENFSSNSIKWSKFDELSEHESIGIEIARGCIFKCGYCTYKLLGKKAGDYTRTKEIIRSELIRNYEEHNISHYWCTDEIINDSEDKVNFIVDVLESLPFKVKIASYARLDLFWKWPWMIKSLKDAGFVAWDLGIETINDKSGSAVGKGLGKTRTIEALHSISELTNNEMFICAQWILGLPYDTIDYFNELFEFLHRPDIKDVITSNSFKPLYLHSGNLSNFTKYQYKLEDQKLHYYMWTNQMGVTQAQAAEYSLKFKNYFNHLGHLGAHLSPFDVPGFLAKAKKFNLELTDLIKIKFDKETKEKLLHKIQFEYFLSKQKFIDNTLEVTGNKSTTTAMRKYLDWKSQQCSMFWSPT